MVGHAGTKAPHAIATSRVTHDVNLVGIYIAVGLHHHDNLTVEGVVLGTEMKVPCVGDGSRTEINGTLWAIQSLLVLPLLIVQFGRGTATAMKRDVQSVAIGWLGAIDAPMQFHGEAVVYQHLIAVGIGKHGTY